jgi:hypothetical protein
LGKYILWNNLKERKVVYSVIDKIIFKDKKNTLEEIDNLLYHLSNEFNHFESYLFPRLSLRVKIENEEDFHNIVGQAQAKKKEYVASRNSISNKIIFFNNSEEIYQTIDENILLHAPNIVSWRAMEAEIIIKALDDFGDVSKEISGGKYIDALWNNKSKIEANLEIINKFLEDNEDYFDYRQMVSEL